MFEIRLKKAANIVLTMKYRNNVTPKEAFSMRGMEAKAPGCAILSSASKTSRAYFNVLFTNYQLRRIDLEAEFCEHP